MSDHAIKLLVVALFATSASFSPFFSLFMHDKGFDAVSIGGLLSASRVLMLVSTPVICSFADRRALHREVLACLALVAGGAMVAFYFAPRGATTFLALILALYSICTGSKIAICDTIVLHARGAAHYPYQRLWGSATWGVVSLLIGYLLRANHQKFGKGDEEVRYDVIPVIHAFSMLLFALTLVKIVPPMNSNSIVDGRYVPAGASSNYVRIVSDGAVLGPIICGAAILSTSEVALNNFLFPYVRRELGGPPELFSYVLALHSVSEVIAFSVGPKLLLRVGHRNLFMMSAAAFSFKAFFYSVIVDPWSLLYIEGFHGMCFGFMWTAAVSHMSSVASRIIGSEAHVANDSGDEKGCMRPEGGEAAGPQRQPIHFEGPAKGPSLSSLSPSLSVGGSFGNEEAAGSQAKSEGGSSQCVRASSLAMTTLWFFSQGLPPIVGGIASGVVVQFSARHEVMLFQGISLVCICMSAVFFVYGRLGLFR
jgi:PPP family 3-phenylpropionic acid transporter